MFELEGLIRLGELEVSCEYSNALTDRILKITILDVIIIF